MRRLLYLICILFPVLGFAQVKSIGTPNIYNYPKSVYHGGTQNWGIAQDQKGFMYFANNDGVLRFDGLHWTLIEVSKSSPVRSIFVDQNNRIFVGLFNDFGMLKLNKKGLYTYESLRHLLPSDTGDFNDIWRIHEIPQGIVFQSYEYLFIYRDNAVQIIKPRQHFHFSFQVNGRLIMHEPDLGLFEYINGQVEKVPWSDPLSDNSVCAILPYRGNQLLIGTERNGIYKFADGILEKWNTPVNRLVTESKLFSATRIIDNHFAFGTILNGVVISDINGNIIQHINRDQGLQNNTVLSTFSDRDENLWLGLDNGIDYVEVNSPLSFISDFEGLGTGYTCRVFNGKLYLGTNQGLYVKTFNNFSNNDQPFELVKNSAGQVWSLDIFDDELICGHHLGTFRIKNNEAIPISSEEGAWKYIRLKNHPQYLLGGHYAGLVLLQKGSNGWTFKEKIKGFNESSRFLHQDDDGVIWISHGGKGVFRVVLTENLDSVKQYKLYTTADGLPSNEQNILFEYQGKGYISTIDGIYVYQNDSDTFVKDQKLNDEFQFNGRLKTLETDDSGNVWFIAQNESGVLRQNEDLTYTKITAPFRQLDGKYVNEFEFIYPYSNDHVFIGIDNGFAHYSSKFPKSYSKPFKSFITKVELPYIDSTLYFSIVNEPAEFEFPYRRNAFRFHYTAPFFENLRQLQFSYRLENFSDDWSDWSADSYKDFTNLHEGDYTFQLKAKNIYGVESDVAEFHFTILPPWHRSQLAYYTYLVFFILLVFFLIRFILHRIELSKKREKLKHQQELQKKEEQFQHQALVAEKEIIRLRNEKLRNEMVHRDKELANQTMSIIQKNKFLMKLKDELQRIQKSTNDAQLKPKMAMLSKRLDKEIDNKQQNKIFETYFDEVHNEFFKRLKEKYPQLSPREMRICAYIRMNLTSKEIAALLNITDRGVEISRYRLRKKLDLPRETNLSTFLSNI